MKPNTDKTSMNARKALLLTLGALLLSGCALNNMSIVRLPSDQERLFYDIASTRNDGNSPMPIKEINALLITPGGLNPPGKILNVTFVLNITKTGLTYYLFGVATLDINNNAESECIRVIDNFRKAGLPPEFRKLTVSADLPGEYRSTDFKSYGESTFCAFVITREELTNGSPPRQTFKNFRHIE